MNLDSKTRKWILILVAISLGMVWLMQHLEFLPQFINGFFVFFSPLITGIMIAFVVNMPMRWFENLVFGRKWRKNDQLRKKLARPLSMLFAFAVISGIIGAVIFLVTFDIVQTFVSFTQQLPKAIRNFQEWLEQLTSSNPDVNAILTGSNFTFEQMVERFVNWVNNTMSEIASSAFGWVTALLNGFFNLFIGLVFAIYILLLKERLGRQIKQVAYAVFKEGHVDRFLQMAQLVNKVFSRFISGQGLEACILGGLVFIGMNIFGFHYPLTISVLVIVGALIPIFGAFIAGVLGALLILVVSPIEAFWFVIMLIVIQQIEGNFIYPRVVGKSVGLPAIWVFVAVTFGSKLMGFLGLLLGVPAFSVIYVLIKSWSAQRVEAKHIEGAKLDFERYDEAGDSGFESLAAKVSPQKRLFGKARATEAEGRKRQVSTQQLADNITKNSSRHLVRRFTAHFDLNKAEAELEQADKLASKLRKQARNRGFLSFKTNHSRQEEAVNETPDFGLESEAESNTDHVNRFSDLTDSKKNSRDL